MGQNCGEELYGLFTPAPPSYFVLHMNKSVGGKKGGTYWGSQCSFPSLSLGACGWTRVCAHWQCRSKSCMCLHFLQWFRIFLPCLMFCVLSTYHTSGYQTSLALQGQNFPLHNKPESSFPLQRASILFHKGLLVFFFLLIHLKSQTSDLSLGFRSNRKP